MVNGFVKGPEPHGVLVTDKEPLGKKAFTALGIFVLSTLVLSVVAAVIFLLGVLCYGAWSSVIG